MRLKNTSKLLTIFGILTFVSNFSYASGVYGILELGYSKSNFDNATARLPENDTAISDVVKNNDNSSFAAIGLGYDWDNSPWRTEIVYRKHGDQKFSDDTIFTNSLTERTIVKVKQESLMLNLLYDFDINVKNVTPYLGGGLGGTKVKLSATQSDVDESNTSTRSASFDEYSDVSFSWNLVAGINYDITESAVIGLGYRYTDAGKISTDENCKSSNDAYICDSGEKHSADLRMHSLFFNVNYYF